MTFVYFKSPIRFKSLNPAEFLLNPIQLGIGEEIGDTNDITSETITVSNVPNFEQSQLSQLFRPLATNLPSIFNGFTFNGSFYDKTYNAFYVTEEKNVVRNVYFSAYSTGSDLSTVFQLRQQFGGSPISQIFLEVETHPGFFVPTQNFIEAVDDEDGIWVYTFPGLESEIKRNEIDKPFNLEYETTIQDAFSAPLTAFDGLRSNLYYYDFYNYVDTGVGGLDWALAEVNKNTGAATLHAGILGTSSSTSRSSAVCKRGNDLIIFFDDKVFELAGNALGLTATIPIQIGTISGFWFNSVIYSSTFDKYIALGGTGNVYPATYSTINVYAIDSTFSTVTLIGTKPANSTTNISSLILPNTNLAMFSGISGNSLIDIENESFVSANSIFALGTTLTDPVTSLVTSVCKPSANLDVFYATYRAGVNTEVVDGNFFSFVEFYPI